MTVQFRKQPYGSIIGDGSHVFRHYGVEAPDFIELDYFTLPADIKDYQVIQHGNEGGCLSG